jgi:hypothetical protein
MSYLSLLFPATQDMSKMAGMIRETKPEVHTAPNAAENARTDAGDRSNDYRLPPGIASLEHWLDLNA